METVIGGSTLVGNSKDESATGVLSQLDWITCANGESPLTLKFA